ncbi:MAG: GTPase/DUF3482 domain-containing protein [Pseudomonadales bacterium]|nr:GTPase/DUF3482 domain-containing protein [Pseudomonadales bacterium]
MIPVFAVTGHPNKGKSSIVATLAQDDSVAISPQSGTTKISETFTIELGQCRYQLVDTPGFQRPHKALAWLHRHATSAEQRSAAVRQFVADESCQREFPDEVRLLAAIVAGAAVLYVVDGSRPYGAEYEAEMEILRWTGQPGMALINPIENEAYVEPWKHALGQYFKVVKVFNAMQADFEKQLAILESFSHLKEEWREPLHALIDAYRNRRRWQKQQSVEILASQLRDLCSYQLSQKVLQKSQAVALQWLLEERFYRWLKEREQQGFEALKQLYRYRHLRSEVQDLPLQDNLFDTEKWIVWGLSKKQLTTVAAIGGAAAGAVLDLSLLGHSLLLGTLGGSLISASGVWFGARHIAGFKLKGLPLGGYEARQGPVRNKNFPYVVLGRFMVLENALRNRNHARRDSIELKEGDLAASLEKLTQAQQKKLYSAMDSLSRQKPVDELVSVLEPLFEI